MITTKKDEVAKEEVKASPFKIVEKSVSVSEKSVPVKTEKLLIDLPSQKEKVMFKTSQSKTLEIVEKMLSDLKVKSEGTSTSTPTARTISKKEIVSKENTDSNTVSFVSTDEIYEWNIDGLSEQEIVTKVIHMSMVGIAYQNNHDLDQPDIVNLLVTGFSGTLHGWWDSYITKESRESIKHAVKKNDEGLPIFYESIDHGIPNGVNTLIYTIIKHYVGTPSNISSHDYLNNLSCPTMSEYRWYQDVFTSRVMLRKDCLKPYWKEKFIDGLLPIFAHKVKQELMGKNDSNNSIDYDNLTYGDIFSTIKKLGINMCNDKKLVKHQLKDKRKAKYEMRNFCVQYGLSPITPSRQKKYKI